MRDPLALVPAELTRVLGRDPGVYRTELLSPQDARTPLLWRVRGDSFSFVLKLHAAGGSFEAPHNWRYWAREPEAYTSGLTEYAYAESGLTAPVLMSRMDRADGTVVLWLEDVPETPDVRLSFGWVAEVARRLGRAQAVYLCGRDLPAHAWLSQQWLRQYSTHNQAAGDAALGDDALWSRPVVRRHWDGVRAGLTELRARRRRLVEVVEALPRTLCHLRLSPRTLLASGDRCVLVDWSYCGTGAVGEDLGMLVLEFVQSGRHPVEKLDELDDAVFRGYVEGLRAGGWDGDERLARLGMVAAGALRHAALVGTVPRPARARDAEPGEATEQWYERTGTVLRHLLGWSVEAIGDGDDLPPLPRPRAPGGSHE